MVMKAFATRVLLEFDLRVLDKRPECRALGARNSPPRDAQILLRRRQQ
jgi:hypothetical protein